MQRKILNRIVIIVICIGIVTMTIFFWGSYKKEKIIKKANEAGVNIEFSGSKIFCIKEGAVTYYYNLGISEVDFIKYDISVEEPGIKVKEGDLIVSIKKRHNNEIQGSYDDSRIVLKEDGSEKLSFSSMFFVCNDNFDRSSLVTTGWIDAEQKAIDAYEIVIGYVPIENLKQYYNRALTLCNQLNE
ncbi:MAG: hypothetical protein IKQ00_03335 [Butyrivibrio sp.]|nr:hypothetical protein [Butyrivibrio sp.]